MVFKNHDIELLGAAVAISTGHYYSFICATGEEKGQETKVEVTFGYKRKNSSMPCKSSRPRPFYPVVGTFYPATNL